MKLKPLILALAFAPALLQATAIGSGSSGYTARGNGDTGGISFYWTDISGTGTSLTGKTAWDDFVFETTLGSEFSFYGRTYNSVNVSTNGNLQFNSINTSYTPTTLTNFDFGATVFAFWDDIVFDNSASPDQGVYYQYFAGGLHPEMSGPTSVIQWSGNYFGDQPGPTNVQFQALLEHSTGRILIQLNNEDTARGNGSNATIGIQDGNGTHLEWLAPRGGGGSEEPIELTPMDIIQGGLQSTVVFAPSAVPEPGTYALIGLGLAGMVAIRRRRK